MNDMMTVAELMAFLATAPREGVVWIKGPNSDERAIQAVEIKHTPRGFEYPGHVVIVVIRSDV